MSVAARAPLGGLSPLAFVMNVTPGSSGLDLTTVTSVSVLARGSGTSNASWFSALSNQTTDTLTITHYYVAGDLSSIGLIQLYALMSTVGGPIPTSSVQLTVYDPFLA